MGALSSMFAATGTNRKHKSLSSNSLNSSQEQEPSPEAEATHLTPDPVQMLAVKRKGGQRHGSTLDTARRSIESLVSKVAQFYMNKKSNGKNLHCENLSGICQLLGGPTRA